LETPSGKRLRKVGARSQREAAAVKRETDEGGVAAIEFALVLSLLILLLLGIVNFGIAFFKYQGLQAAAREGARFAAVEADQSVVKQRVHGALAGVIAPSEVDITIEDECGPTKVVRVTLAHPYEINIPLWRRTEITMRTVGEFRCEI
jgi:Flp pilus assembly protein TadG